MPAKGDEESHPGWDKLSHRHHLSTTGVFRALLRAVMNIRSGDLVLARLAVQRLRLAVVRFGRFADQGKESTEQQVTLDAFRARPTLIYQRVQGYLRWSLSWA